MSRDPIRRSVLAGLLVAGLASVALAQLRTPPKADETHATLNWLMGRWRMPVTCELADGSTVDIEEAILVRPAAEDAAGRTVRATFFGIDVADARRCFNLTHSDVPDRRGVVYLTFVAQRGRSDIGLTRLRQNLETGKLRYEITRGRLQVRSLTAPADEVTIHEFDRAGAALEVSLLGSGSDGFRLLERLSRREGSARRPLRRLHFEIVGMEPTPFAADYLEDPRGPRRR